MRAPRSRHLALLVAALLLLGAAPASGHAVLTTTSPPNGAVLAGPPTEVTATFSSSIRVGSRNAAIRNDGTDVLGGEPFTRDSRTLVLPLEPDLADGVYTVRWSIVSNDGHHEEGVIAFAVGEDSGPPVPVLGTRGFVTWQQVTMRTAFFLGVLGAAGVAFFALVVLRPLGAGRAVLRRHAHLLFGAFVLAFVGSDALIHATTGSGTRFEDVLWIAAAASLVGGAAAALAPLYRPLLLIAWAAAAVLAVCPTLAGHSLDPDQPRVIAPLADALHVGAAAFWLGGLASLVLVVGRAPDELRRAAARRFSELAAPAVFVIAAAGTARALTELSAVRQLWSTSYGQTISIKVGLLVALVAVAWRSRAALAARFAQLRRLVLVEIVLLLGVVVAVGTLTALRPGRTESERTVVAAPPPVVQPPPGPAPGAYVDAAQAGRLAVGFAYLDGVASVTLQGPAGNAATDVAVTIDGGQPRTCGRGCFARRVADRSVDVRVGATELRFEVPEQRRDAAAVLGRMTRAYESLSSVLVTERLSPGPGRFQATRFRVLAPDRMAYRIVAASDPAVVGTEGVVIGERRWDRLPGGEWTETAQQRQRLPDPTWTDASRNAHLTGPNELTFYDPTLAAWFRVRFDPETARPLELHMIAAGHFMEHRYSGFDRPLEISPPSR